MSDSVRRTRGRAGNYKLDRGGVPAEFGPFTGVVMSTVDPARFGRLRVYIEAFNDGGANGMKDESKWTTVSYMPPFFGSTPPLSQGNRSTDVGAYPGNPNSYGMWFTPPDVGLTVICIFVNGDRNQGYYIGVAPDDVYYRIEITVLDLLGNPTINFGETITVAVKFEIQFCFGGTQTFNEFISIPFGQGSKFFQYRRTAYVDCGGFECQFEGLEPICVDNVVNATLAVTSPLTACP
jgi:hypothetical protein